MRIPEQPAVEELKHLSSGLYEAARVCKAHAAWLAFGDRDGVPHHPRALLGICVHAVVEDAYNGRLPSGDEDHRRSGARDIFDSKATKLHAAAHPLLRAKFPTPERIPYYHLFREWAALLAVDAAARPNAEHVSAAAPKSGTPLPERPLVETTLRSRDGLLTGRPDYVDPAVGDVVNYKTGAGPDDDPEGLRDSEVRQLRLYVHLAHERGIDLRRGVVVRLNGRRVALEVSEAEAAAEGQSAREALRAFNAKTAEGFKRLAEPSPGACRHCPCIPFCEAFWESATPAWASECGTHVEGTVSAVFRAVMHETALVTLELTVARGTAAPGFAVVQQLPEKWVCAGGAQSPAVGDVIRVVNCRLADDAGETALIRPERLTTAVWTVRRAAAAAADDGTAKENVDAGNG
jgi:hypothetical protein